MTYSSTLWALGQFMRHWGITTATTSMCFVIEDQKAAAYTSQGSGCSSCTGRYAGRTVQLVSIAYASYIGER